MGIDQRGELYRQPLLDAGIGIFEVDFKTGIYGQPYGPAKARYLSADGLRGLEGAAKTALGRSRPDRQSWAFLWAATSP